MNGRKIHVVAFSIIAVSVAALAGLSGAAAGEAKETPADKLQRTFSKLDRDGNQRLSLAEFLTHSASKPDVAHRDFQLFDQDSDDALDLDEFSTVPTVVAAQHRGAFPDPLLTLVDKSVVAMDASFDDWDTKPDVEIDVRQFVGAFTETFGSNATSSSIREADQNRNGRVSRDEARRFLEIQLGVRRSDGKLLREPSGRVCNFMLYQHIDLNGNDRLDRDEFEQRSYLKEKAAEVFDKGDADGDESMSFDEWCGLPNRGFIDPVNDFRKLDTNLDAHVDPQELAAGTPEWKQKMAANVFPGFDADKDGTLTLAEYRLTMQANPVLRWQYVIREEDADGRLAFSDFQFGSSQFPLLRWLCFQRLDVNDDAALDSDEFFFKRRMPDRFFVMNEDGTGWKLVFQFEGYAACGSPAVSPDGKLIAFDAWTINPQSPVAMFVMGIDGGNPRELGDGAMPTWSKDGTMLAYSRSGVGVITADGQESRGIDPEGWGAQWSPDGKKIAFTDSEDIRVFDVQTATVRTVLASDAHEYSRFYWNMTWSPDSQRICFKATKPDGKHEVATVSATGDEPRLKVHHSTEKNINADFAWHPNGDRIVFAMSCQERGCMQLYQIDPDRDDPPKLVAGQDETGNHTDVCWTPDGKRLIVVTGNF